MPIFPAGLRSLFAAAAVIAVTASASADTPIVGSLLPQGGGTVPVAPRVFVDLSHPATTTGVVNYVTFRWVANAPCSASANVRILRPTGTDVLGTYEVVAQSGPIATATGVIGASFPSTTIKPGDVMSIAQLKSGCGGVALATTSRPTDLVFEGGGDYTGTTALSNSGFLTRTFAALDVVASNGPQHLVGIIPVAGAAAGAFNSFFRTELTLTAVGGASDVTVIFHPAGASASPSDPFTLFHMDANATKNFPDIVTTIGRTGLGSLEILSTGPDPVVTTRVYNDGGAAGTSGFTEDLVTTYDLHSPALYTWFSIPADLTNYRANVGIRSGAMVSDVIAVVYDAAGHALGTATHHYAPEYFEQVSLAAFIAPLTIPAGGSVLLSTQQSNPVVAYVSTTDNRTNDSSLKMLVFK